MCTTHRLIDVHVYDFIEGIVDKVDSSCAAPCIAVLVLGAQPNAVSLRRATNEQSRLRQKLPPGSIHNLLQDRWGGFDREGNFRGQVVGFCNCADMARKGVTQQLICLLLISDGQGSHNVCQSGLAICKLHWQQISIGLVPAFKQILLALCHELHIANTY